MFTTASTTALFVTMYSSLGTLIGTVLGYVLPTLAALIGLGFAIRKVRKYVTGRKF